MIQLEAYSPQYFQDILQLFYDTVHTVNAGDYTQAQLDAWAPREPDRQRWEQNLSQSTGVVALEDERVVGIATLAGTAEFDLLYIHPQYQRRGIAGMLAQRIEEEARRREMCIRDRACVLIPAAATVVYLLFERWRDVTVFIGVMLMLPAVWFLAIRLWDFFTSGVAFDGEYYTLRYSKGMFLHTVIIPKSKMAYVDVRQSIIQKTDQKCDVKFRTIFESRNIHHIRNIDRQEAIDICGLDVDAGDETKTPIRPAVK